MYNCFKVLSYVLSSVYLGDVIFQEADLVTHQITRIMLEHLSGGASMKRRKRGGKKGGERKKEGGEKMEGGGKRREKKKEVKKRG